MNLEQPEKSLIEQIKALLNIIRNGIPGLGKGQASEIKKYLDQTETLLQELNQLPNSYIELVDEYLKLKDPFARKPEHTSEEVKFKSDLREYQELLKHAMRVGNTSILDKWSIKHPERSGFHPLVRKRKDYQDALEYIRDKEIPNNLTDKEKTKRKYYFTYLIEQLDKIP
jgi:hypothetical protein